MGNRVGTSRTLRLSTVGVMVGVVVIAGLTSPGIATASALPMQRGVPVTVTALTDEVSLRGCDSSGTASMPYRWISFSARGSDVSIVVQQGAFNGFRWSMFDDEALTGNGPWFSGWSSMRKCRSYVLSLMADNVTKIKWIIKASRPGYATTRTEITLPVR